MIVYFDINLISQNN